MSAKRPTDHPPSDSGSSDSGSSDRGSRHSGSSHSGSSHSGSSHSGDHVPAGDGRSIVVIGGGLAGCSAALALARRGRRVTLVEARSRLGGRTGSYIDQTSGQRVDYCQHVGMACCTSLRRLIDELDQSELWHVQRELYFYGPEGQRQTLRALRWLPPPAHLSPWLLRWPGLNWSDRLAIGRTMLAVNQIRLPDPRAIYSDSLDLDRQSALAWLQARGQSTTAINRFWSTIIVSALGEELASVGVLAMAKVFQDGFLRKRTSFHLLIPQRPLDELFGSRFQTALQRAGVDVLTAASVIGLDWQGDCGRCVRLADGRRLDASAIVLAVPWYSVERIVGDCPAADVRAIAAHAAALQASRISGIHTWWDRPWLPTPHAVLVDRLCQWVFPGWPRDPTSPAESTYYQVVISASHSLPRGDSTAVARSVEADLHEVFPESRSARLLRVKVVTDPQAVFSVSPGTTELRPPLGTRNGNLFWAGDWVRTGWPATMEGAIRSGFAAADALCADR